MIIKIKFYCKGGSEYISFYHDPGAKKEIRFVQGKWYDGEYETWSDNEISNKESYRLNNRWKNYWVVNEMDQKEGISIAHMNTIFEMKMDNLRT